jgi:hypothetical protein
MGQAYTGPGPIGSIDDRDGRLGSGTIASCWARRFPSRTSAGRREATATVTAFAFAFAIAIALTIVAGSYEWLELGGSPAAPIAKPSLTGVVGVEGGRASWKHPGFHPLAHVPIRVAGTTAGGEHLARELTADRNGRFRLHLPPGRYHITAIFPGWRGHAQVTVKWGHPVGIRLTEWVL